MLKAAILFFVLGLFVFICGALGVAGVSPEVGRLFLIVFLIFSFVSFVGEVTTGKSRNSIR
jgi:uncharacterized membrane protein YtjA (UPF0391 family)